MTIDAFVSVVAFDFDGGIHYRTTVRGAIVAPGLAATPALEHGRPTSDLTVLVHMASGTIVSGVAYCGEHIGDAVRAAIHSGIDWTAPIGEVTADAMWDATILELEIWVACDYRERSR